MKHIKKSLRFGLLITGFSLAGYAFATPYPSYDFNNQKRDEPVPLVKPNFDHPYQPQTSDLQVRIREELAKRVWQTTLGRMVQAYIYTDAKPSSVIALGQEISDRVLSSAELANTRISALQLMFEDIYQTGRMSSEIQKRVGLLVNNISQQSSAQSQYSGKGIAYQAMITFIALLPLGSPAVRGAAKYAVRVLSFNRFFKEAEAVPMSLLLGQAFKGYQISFPLNAFFRFFGAYTLVYFFWFDWTKGLQHDSITQDIKTMDTWKDFDVYVSQLENL